MTASHQETPSVVEAAIWWNEHRNDSRSIGVIPTLRDRFDLTVKQAIAALSEAEKLRGGAQ